MREGRQSHSLYRDGCFKTKNEIQIGNGSFGKYGTCSYD